jgi:hypothetical protein
MIAANMTVKELKMERFSVISSKPFDVVIAALKTAVGQPDMVAFTKAARGARTFAELERAVYAPVTVLMDERPGGVHVSVN